MVGGDHAPNAAGGDVFAPGTEYASVAQSAGRAAFVATTQRVRAVLDDQQAALAGEAQYRIEVGRVTISTAGHALGFIATLEHPEHVGVVLEFAHAAMAGLNPAHEVAHALYAGKLDGIHLNAQRPLRFDQDLRFGGANLKDSFFVVKLLEEERWPGPRTFDAHPYRTTDEEGIWGFVEGCIRAYEILAENPEFYCVLVHGYSSLSSWSMYRYRYQFSTDPNPTNDDGCASLRG